MVGQQSHAAGACQEEGCGGRGGRGDRHDAAGDARGRAGGCHLAGRPHPPIRGSSPRGRDQARGAASRGASP
eukprot:8321472-Lingulodinium_polyedra.AAC.1